jgi:hypothetical protein
VNGQRKAAATPHQAYYVDVSPGSYEVRIMHNKVTLTVKQGQHVFIRSEVDANKSIFGEEIYPVLVDPHTAREELKRLGLDAGSMR